MEGSHSPIDRIELLKRGGFTIVEEPSTEIFSGPVQLPGIDLGPLQEDLEMLAESCTTYLSGGIITDSYRDHSERREARDGEIRRTYGEPFANAFEANRLRLNKIGNVLQSFHLLVRELDRKNIHTAEADQVRKLTTRLPDFSSYHTASTDEKVVLVKELSAIAQELLHLVYKS